MTTTGKMRVCVTAIRSHVPRFEPCFRLNKPTMRGHVCFSVCIYMLIKKLPHPFQKTSQCGTTVFEITQDWHFKLRIQCKGPTQSLQKKVCNSSYCLESHLFQIDGEILFNSFNVMSVMKTHKSKRSGTGTLRFFCVWLRVAELHRKTGGLKKPSKEAHKLGFVLVPYKSPRQTVSRGHCTLALCYVQSIKEPLTFEFKADYFLRLHHEPTDRANNRFSPEEPSRFLLHHFAACQVWLVDVYGIFYKEILFCWWRPHYKTRHCVNTLSWKEA